MISNKQIKENKETITELLKNIDRKGIDDLVSWLNESDFFTAPASTMFHGNYEGGLAAHSYKVYEEFEREVDHYKLSVPKYSIAIAGILHDICKVNNYIPNYLKSGNISESKPYKVEDNFPVGHGEKSVIMSQRYIQLTEQEALIIRWHMGSSDPAWDYYKEKVEKEFPEITLFQNIDKEVSLLYKL